SKIVSLGLGTIYFSVDGIDELHNKIRGVEDTYIRTERAIWNIYNAKKKIGHGIPKMGILSTISCMNVERIDEMLAEFEKYPIDFVYLRAMGELSEDDAEKSLINDVKATPFFVSTGEKSHLLSEDQVSLLRCIIKKLKKERVSKPFYLNLSHIETLGQNAFTKGLFMDFPCHICTTVVTLTPFGEVVPCPFFTDFVLGNLDEEDSLDSIWGNKKHHDFLKKQRSGKFAVCKKCSMRHFYPGFRETFRQVFFPYLYALRLKNNR
ncbi:MAG: SPASM domain-containing protein, partial [Thermodesulfobacteriota bacterium]|nr:SPASM domain-containing protein [Thermodesulfobacteriota bacterium]